MITVFDLEANGLLREATELHCVSLRGLGDSEASLYADAPYACVNGGLMEGVAILHNSTALIGHNIAKYDIPLLIKLGYGDVSKGREIIDTLHLSKLQYNDIYISDARRKSLPSYLKGKHSLKAWGFRLRCMKGDYEGGWAEFNEDMALYAIQDAEVSTKIYNYMSYNGALDAQPLHTRQLEVRFAMLIAQQEMHGVRFDQDAAEILHVTLVEEAEKAEEHLFKVFQPLKMFKKKPKPKRQSTLDKHKELGYYTNKKGEYGVDELTEFNPTSRQHIAHWLQYQFKWRPVEFTEKGSVIINGDVLNNLKIPEGKILAHYFNVQKLLGMLVNGNNAWMKLCTPEGRIHGNVDTLGAVTRRCTHNRPNLGQVPSAKSYMGKATRALFIPSEGMVQIGADADALELRALGHYLFPFDGGKFAEAVHSGDKDKGTDAHTMNMRAAGLSSRDLAKTMIYGYLYGAGDAKLGDIVGGGKEEGTRLRAKFLKNMPALEKLSNEVKKRVKLKKVLKAIDGGTLKVRSQHSALNTLLQSFGAITCKAWAVNTNDLIAEKLTFGIDYAFVLNVHDEVQIEAKPEHVEFITECLHKAAEMVTEQFKLRIPFVVSVDVGKNWAETH